MTQDDGGEAAAGTRLHPVSPGEVLWREHHRLPWHLALVGIYAITVLAVLPDASLSQWGLADWLAVGGLTFVAVAYAALMVFARPTMGGWRALTYLTIMTVGVSVAIAGHATSTLFLFVAFTHTWALTGSRRGGTVFSALLATGAGWGIAAGVGQAHGWVFGAIVALASFGFSVAMGFSILTLVSRMRERSQLAAQLVVAQHQLAEAHWAENVTAQRESIAQDIHDTLAQGFTSIVMLAQVARTDIADGRRAAAQDRLDLIEQTARDNLAEARALVTAHAPVALAADGLGDAIRRLANRLQAEASIETRVELADAEEPLDRDANRDVVLLRACQEALANVRKHSGATRVQIHLETSSTGAHLLIRDDGAGLPESFVPGIGLESMQARVVAAGGSMTIRPPSHAPGTQLDVWLPGPATAAMDEPNRRPN